MSLNQLPISAFRWQVFHCTSGRPEQREERQPRRLGRTSLCRASGRGDAPNWASNVIWSHITSCSAILPPLTLNSRQMAYPKNCPMPVLLPAATRGLPRESLGSDR